MGVLRVSTRGRGAGVQASAHRSRQCQRADVQGTTTVGAGLVRCRVWRRDRWRRVANPGDHKGRPYGLYRGSGVCLVYLAAVLIGVAGHAAEATTPVSFSVGTDGRARIEVPSAADLYHVLYYRSDPDDATTETATAIHMGAAGSVVLSDSLRLAAGDYRVATFRKNAPGDADGDETDDLAELKRTDVGQRAPLNAAASIALADGATSIPDLSTYETLSVWWQTFPGEAQLANRKAIKFIILNPGNGETIYYQNTKRYRHHYLFGLAILGWTSLCYTTDVMCGAIIYHPNAVAPSGELGTFLYSYQQSHIWPFSSVARSHEVIAAGMPFLRNNLVYFPATNALAKYEEEKASYASSRVPVYLTKDLGDAAVFSGLNPGVGYGRLKVFEPAERPTARDVAVLRNLPNELSTVAGVISLEPQTPLSHVNLRAIQDDVPNAYIGTALDDPMVTGLLGRYVRYEVSENREHRFSWTNPDTGAVEERVGYLLTEATAEEVADHHDARRPAEAQTPTRDLTETAYKDLDDIAFADSDAFGVKAANVAAMRDFGFTAGTVPDGYALPFYFYDEFMKHNDFYDDVDTLLADTDFQGSIATREAELKKLRRRIENGALPDWMTTKLGELQAEFTATTSIRCRSSTNNEDLPGFSGAGLYDSYTHHPREGHLSKSIKQVFASLWNLRAFEERDFHRIDHKAAAMGVLLHPNYSDEKANGVAVSDDPFYRSDNRFYVNAQVGEDLVTNPSASAVPEELLLGTGEEFTTKVVQRSNLVADDVRVLSEAHIATLQAALRTIHSRFRTLYEIAEDEDEFAMEIEFKITAAGTFAVKQARPWVY